jgi:hypothetical protein
MAATPEAKVKKKVKECLESMKAYYTMPVTGGFGRSGVPDFLVCYRGTFIGIECKANGNRPTALQESNMVAIRAARGAAFVVDETNVQGLEQRIENWFHTLPVANREDWL